MYENSWISGMATMKRVKNRRGSAVPNAKKMYEEAQMVRRVKSYLSNMKVITDEEKLKEMSHQCEAPPCRSKFIGHMILKVKPKEFGVSMYAEQKVGDSKLLVISCTWNLYVSL